MDKRYAGIIALIILLITTISIISIFIARGYNLTGTEIKENGILNLLSNPEGAKIFINGEERATTPKKIELTAGNYTIEIQKENYKSWKKEVTVEPSIVTDISATLFPKELDLEQLTFSDLDTVFFSSDGDIALYTITREPNNGIWLIKLEKTIFELSSSQPTKISEIETFPEQCMTSKDYNIEISEDNTKAIFSCNLKSYKVFYLIDLKNVNSTYVNINEEIGFNPTNITFGFDSNKLLIADSQILALYDVPSKKISLISRKVEGFEPDFTPLGKEFLLLEYNYDLQSRYLYRLNSNLEKTELNLDEGMEIKEIRNITGSSNNPDMFVFTTSEFSALYDIQHSDTSPILPFSESETNNIHWSPKGSSFTFLEGETLKSAEIEESPDGDTKVETSVLIENYDPLLYRIIWAANSQQLLLNDIENKKIYAIDLDGSNQTLLFEGQLTFPQAFKLSANETFLVLLLEDDEGYSNLYSVKLKI